MKKYQLSSWDLSEIKPADLQKVFNEIETRTKRIEQWRPKLKDTIPSKDFLSLLAHLEEIQILNSKIGVYAQLWFAEDSSNQGASALLSQVENFLTKMNNQLLFFGLWFKQLPQREASRLIRSSGKYHYFLEKMYQAKPYVLKEKEEKIINIKDVTGVSALNSI